MVKRKSKPKKEIAPASQSLVEDDSKIQAAGQFKLMWWKFRKSIFAVIGGIVVILMYFMAITCEFFAPKTDLWYDVDYVYAPPQPVRLFNEGRFEPYVYGLKYERDPNSFKRLFEVDEETRIPFGFFVKGAPYKLWGLIPMDVHFIGPKDPEAPFFLLGADKSGRDVLSRTIYSARISMTVGTIGVLVSFLIGIIIGGISGISGGWIDNLIQRFIEILNSIPQVPMLLAMAAAVPVGMSSVQVYFIVSILLALLSWTGMARVVRGRFLALRTEDFILAATLDGASQFRLITKHMLPSFFSHIIASITLSIPYMILNETFLSFLGVGLRPPAVSWGIMLQDTRQIVAVAEYPWLLYPAVAVMIVILSMNFLGNGLRDAADPYAN
jgi:peptide/nickel transport system permease protein